MTTAMALALEPLEVGAFAPFGDVLCGPERAGERVFHDSALGSPRTDARMRLHVNHVAPATLPYVVGQLERHPFTSQTFLPLDVSRYIVVVAPAGPDGGPDSGQAKAFWAPGTLGVTYRAGVWHHGIITLDRPARFAVLMWRVAPTVDDEFFDLDRKIELRF